MQIWRPNEKRQICDINVIEYLDFFLIDVGGTDF